MTIKKIAMLAGVSPGTVDRVINNRGHVRPEVEERIQSIIKEIGYTPNLSAKSLALKRKGMKVGVIFHVKDSSFDRQVLKGIEAAQGELRDFGISFVFRTCQNFDADDQLRQIDDLLKEEVSALAITPINVPRIAMRIDELIEAGLPVFCFVNDICCRNPHPFIGTNPAETGEIASGLFQMLAQEKPQVLGIVSPKAVMMGHSKKIVSLRNALQAEAPWIKILEPCEFEGSSDVQMYQAVGNYLEQHPDLTMLWYASSMSEGGIFALEENKLLHKVKIITLDVPDFVRKGLKERYISATISQNPVAHGYNLAKTVFYSFLHDTYGAQLSYTVPCGIILKENCARHRAALHFQNETQMSAQK